MGAEQTNTEAGRPVAVGVGIIGTGYVARDCHGPAVRASDGARLAAVLSRQESAGREFLSTLDATDARPYDDLAAFLADPDIGLVVVASPDGLHFPQAQASLRAGKHVIVEKPMALSLAEARTLVEVAEARGLVLAVSYHLRCHAGHELLRQRIRDGALGAIRYLRLAWSFPIAESNWRARGDVARWWSLSATGTHCLDMARWFGDDVDDWARFAAVLNNTRWRGRDESAVIAAQLASGPSVDVLASIQFEEHTRLEIFGDRGSAFCEGTFGPDRRSTTPRATRSSTSSTASWRPSPAGPDHPRTALSVCVPCGTCCSRTAVRAYRGWASR